MTHDERIRAVIDFGFTERQARFLVLVLRHGGVCVPRHTRASLASRTVGGGATRSSTGSSGAATHTRSAACTTERGSITCITSRCTTPSAKPPARIVVECRRAWLSSV